jgi:hypothetical protein
MFKKQFIFILSLLILHLFLSQSFAFLISNLNHSSETGLSINSIYTNEDVIQEFNISTHANLWSVNKDESSKEENNLEKISTLAYLFFCGLIYSTTPPFFLNTIFLAEPTISFTPLFLLNNIFRL